MLGWGVAQSQCPTPVGLKGSREASLIFRTFMDFHICDAYRGRGGGPTHQIFTRNFPIAELSWS